MLIFGQNGMYKKLIRPLLFLIAPETVHHLVVIMVKIMAAIPGASGCIKKILFVSHPSLKTTVAGIEFPNKVGLAAGFDKNAEFYNPFSAFGFSFIEIGTVTPLPQPGNPKPRSFRLPKDKALINRMGFNNKGVEYAADRLKNNRKKVIIGGNIGKNTLTPNESAANDYEKCCAALYDHVDYLAVNVSCPNVDDLTKLQDHDSLREILERIMKIRSERSIRKPVFLKISPDLSYPQLDEMIVLYRQMGLDGIIATNTTTCRDGLTSSPDQVQQIGKGGMSGYPLKNRALDVVRYICKQDNNIPVIGVGGILTAQDAVDMIEAGASLVEVYTGFIYEGPCIVKRINKALIEHYSGSNH
jgi:dihydroorotate dehydrogenase